MGAEAPLVFVDSNILVYSVTEGLDPRHAKAREVVRKLVEDETLAVSTQVLQELLVTLTRKMRLSMDDALAVAGDFGEYTVFTIDKTAILDAGRLARKMQISFWDALVVVSASRVGATVLLTEDLNHSQRVGSVEVTNPFV